MSLHVLRRAAVGTGFIVFMNGFSLAVSFTFYVVASRILGPGEVGSVSLLFMTSSIFNTLTLLALNSAAIRYVSESIGSGSVEGASAAFRSCLRLASIISVPSYFLAAGLSGFISSSIGGLDAPSIIIAVSAGLILNYTSIIGGGFYGLMLYGQVAAQNILFMVVGRSFALALAWIGLGVHGVAFGILIGASACLLYSVIAFRGRLPGNGLTRPRDLLEYSAPIYIWNVIGLAQGWLDIAILYGLTRNLSAVGVYYLVVSSTTVLTVLPNSFASVLFPTMSFKMGESGLEGVKEIIESSIRLTALIMAPLCLGLASAAPTALTIAYGSRYKVGSSALRVAALGAFPSALYTVLNSTLQAVGYTRPVALAGLASIVVDLVVLTFAVPAYSGFGAALARVAMALAGFAVAYKALQSRVKFKIFLDWKIMAYAASTAIPILFIERLDFDAKVLGILELSTFTVLSIVMFRILKPIGMIESRMIMEATPNRLKSIVKFILK
ncbi:MAG: oligosaccharide flippase family protein [Candidatus Bathyarchaeia archaeon]